MIKKNWKKIIIILLIIIVSTSIGAYAAYLLNATEVSYLKSDGNTISVKAALDDLYTKANHESTATFTQGQLVTYKNEQFYALTDVKSTDKTMEIFCKTNINPSTCAAQANAAYNTTACAFSSTNYWRSIWKENLSLDLNIVPGYASGDVIDKAKSYASKKGALSGRLLTKAEVETLTGADFDNWEDWSSMTNTTIKNMINGAGNSQGFEYYWLGSAIEDYDDGVWIVIGEFSLARSNFFNFSDLYGVRPVLRVWKSDVT